MPSFNHETVNCSAVLSVYWKFIELYVLFPAENPYFDASYFLKTATAKMKPWSRSVSYQMSLFRYECVFLNSWFSDRNTFSMRLSDSLNGGKNLDSSEIKLLIFFGKHFQKGRYVFFTLGVLVQLAFFRVLVRIFLSLSTNL